jgi:hypothetical protein
LSRIAIKPTMQPELFVYAFPVRVYFENTDAGGVVYHSEYLKFLERARTEWLRHLGFEHQSLAREHRTVFVVSAVTAEFAAAARLDDLLAGQGALRVRAGSAARRRGAGPGESHGREPHLRVDEAGGDP